MTVSFNANYNLPDIWIIVFQGKIVKGIWYYFLSSLPSQESFQPPDRYYGLSPTGLARGGTFEDYEGKKFYCE